MESALTKGGSLVDDLNARCVLFIKVPSSLPVCRTREFCMTCASPGLTVVMCFFCCSGCPYCAHCEPLGAYRHEYVSGTV